MPFVFRDVILYLSIRNKDKILNSRGFTCCHNPNPISDLPLTSLLISTICYSNSVKKAMQYLDRI